jgi:hypothetical protein
VPSVLTDAECDELVALCDRLGFSSGETLVEVPLSIRSNSVTLLVPPPEMVVELSRRLAAHIPQHGHAGGKRTDPDFINRRWRVYRYEPPSERVPSEGGGGGQGRGGYFAPHYDAAQVRMRRPSRPCVHLLPCRVGLVSSRIKPYTPPCVPAGVCLPPAPAPCRTHGVAATQRRARWRTVLIDDEPAKGIVRLSQMSVLLYLITDTDAGTGGHQGGHTIFFPSGTADDLAGPHVRVSPQKGAALVFWHGRHPQSPLHEGSPLQPADAMRAKYVIRTDVLFATDPPMANYMQWASSSYVNAMLMASAKMN